METTTVLAGGPAHAIRDAWWFRFIVRAVLLGMAIGAMWFARERDVAFQYELASTFQYNLRLFGLYGAGLVAAGFLFGLAVWLPFRGVRYLPSRLVFAAIALISFVQVYILALRLMQVHHVSGWLLRPRWYNTDEAVLAASTVLAGVAIASGFRARHQEEAQSLDEPTRPSA